MIALRISCLGQFELGATHGVTHIKYHLDLNVYSERGEVQEANGNIPRGSCRVN